MNETFNTNCEFYMDELFNKHYKKWEEKINQEVIQDLTLLAKYKGELAKAFNEVKAQRNTLISCMNDIQERQDELKWLVLDLLLENILNQKVVLLLRRDFKMTYEEMERKCTFIATELVRVYFEGIDREKVSVEKTIIMVPKFINETWAVFNKMRNSNE